MARLVRLREHIAATKADIRRFRTELEAEMEDLRRAKAERLEERGVPNHIGARRFTESECDAIAEALAQRELSDVSVPDAPRAPPPEVMRYMD